MRVYISSLLANGDFPFGAQWLIHCDSTTEIAFLKVFMARELQLEAKQLAFMCERCGILSADRTLRSYGLTSDPCSLQLLVTIFCP